MLMNPADILNHRKFSKFVASHIALLGADVKLIEAMRACAGIDGSVIRQALHWKMPPRIAIKTLVAGQSQIPAGGYTDNSNTLVISAYHVALFEDRGQDVIQTPKRGPVHQVEADLLHELAHWAREKSGRPAAAGVEVGFEFEKQFYGRVVE